jgi:hypothetical protein
MNNQTMSLSEIRSAGLAVLARELGPIGKVRFLQQFEIKTGDYTKKRFDWLGNYRVETLADKIARAKRMEKK